jgi:hypothetical protein
MASRRFRCRAKYTRAERLVDPAVATYQPHRGERRVNAQLQTAPQDPNVLSTTAALSERPKTSLHLRQQLLLCTFVVHAIEIYQTHPVVGMR